MKSTGRSIVRVIARHPRVRPFAAPIAAIVYKVRNRNRSISERWNQARTWETAYWDDWLAKSQDLPKLLSATMPVEDPILTSLIEACEGSTVDILDVGAGPLTMVGKTCGDKTLRITPTDALADRYDELLARHRITPPVRTIRADGEALLETFGEEQFDIAMCQNALDHCYDPVRVLENMMGTVRPGGYVYLRHFINEGEAQQYLGMHQWNLDTRAGRFVIWRPDEAIDVSDNLSIPHSVTCDTAPHADGENVLIVKIQRHIADRAPRDAF